MKVNKTKLLSIKEIFGYANLYDVLHLEILLYYDENFVLEQSKGKVYKVVNKELQRTNLIFQILVLSKKICIYIFVYSLYHYKFHVWEVDSSCIYFVIVITNPNRVEVSNTA